MNATKMNLVICPCCRYRVVARDTMGKRMMFCEVCLRRAAELKQGVKQYALAIEDRVQDS